LQFKHILILILIGTASFSISNFLLNGSLNNTQNLSGELKSPPDSLYLWKIANEPPFKYRVLHKTIVSTTYKLIAGHRDNNETFFLVYKLMSFFFHVAAIIAFYFFLAQSGLMANAFLGALLFSIMPPLMLAYNVPVHTREDTLAYILLTLGLLSIIRNKVGPIITLAILGILCRETLLLLPFVNLFFNYRQSIFMRLFIAAVSAGMFLLLRLYFGMEYYNHWEGLQWNIRNLDQVLGFGFISFGFLWLPFFISFVERDSKIANQLIYDSRLSVLFLIILTTFIGGIFNEIRILYFLAPWVISIALNHYCENKIEILLTIQTKRFQLYAISIFIIIAAATAYAVLKVRNYVSSKYDIPFETWIIATTIQLYLALASIPYFLKRMRNISTS
jgi:hypothetical protein